MSPLYSRILDFKENNLLLHFLFLIKCFANRYKLYDKSYLIYENDYLSIDQKKTKTL